MPNRFQRNLSRRELLWSWGGGLGGLALAQMLGREGLHAATTGGPPPRAKRVVQLFMSGAASQVDTFDYKPELVRRNGRKFDPGGKVELFQSDPGPIMASPWAWKRYGACGKMISDLVPHIGSQADRIAFLHAMVSKSNVHGPATFLQSTGFVLPGYPSMDAWLSYGLGSMNDNLPTFVALPDARGFPPNGPSNWSAGFLPAQHQGTMIRVGRPQPIHDLFPPEDAGFITPSSEKATLAALEELNRAHLEERGEDSQLEARIQSYEMAAKLQLSAPEALDISSEPPAVRKLYGVDEPLTRDFGGRCLAARRLLERGVRFVQVWSGADNGFPRRNWDSHENIAKDHAQMAGELAKPAAALIQDLAAPGLLDATIVYWTPEVRRRPAARAAWAGITIRSRSRPGWPAAASAAASATVRATSGLTRWRRTKPKATTCTPRCCVCWGSTMSG